MAENHLSHGHSDYRKRNGWGDCNISVKKHWKKHLKSTITALSVKKIQFKCAIFKKFAVSLQKFSRKIHIEINCLTIINSKNEHRNYRFLGRLALERT